MLRRFRPVFPLLAAGLLALAGCSDGDPLGPEAPQAADPRFFMHFDFGGTGLPNPTADAFNGARGYNQLLAQINADPNAVWATSALLQGERDFAAKGGNPKRYLSTAWVWFENGSASRPDPYLINCGAFARHLTPVSALCGSQHAYQVAGWQAKDRFSNVQAEFRRFWSTDAELRKVLGEVFAHASKASRPNWNYNDPGQNTGLVSTYRGQLGGAVIGDLWPGRVYDDGRGQFFSALVGKHPKMVAALNAYAVSDAGLVSALRNQSCAYGYICGPEKQVLANMVAALILFENGQRIGPGQATSLVSMMHGKCLDAWSPANGTKVWMQDCQPGNANQRWSYNETTGELRIHGNKCLDGWSARRLDPVVIHDCHGGGNQKWDLVGDDRIRLRGIRDEFNRPMCIDIASYNRSNEALLLLQYCHRGDNQTWRQSPGGTGGAVVSIVSDLVMQKCADAPGNANETQLHLWECMGPGHVNQRFVRTPAGELRVHGKCVDGHAGRVGDPVKVFDCHGGANQKWDLTPSGEIRGVNGLCVDASGAATANGTRLVLWTCTGSSPEQRWTFSMPR